MGEDGMKKARYFRCMSALRKQAGLLLPVYGCRISAWSVVAVFSEVSDRMQKRAESTQLLLIATSLFAHFVQ